MLGEGKITTIAPSKVHKCMALRSRSKDQRYGPFANSVHAGIRSLSRRNTIWDNYRPGAVARILLAVAIQVVSMRPPSPPAPSPARPPPAGRPPPASRREVALAISPSSLTPCIHWGSDSRQCFISLPASCVLLPASCFLPLASCLLLPASYLLLLAPCLLPLAYLTPFHSPPATNASISSSRTAKPERRITPSPSSTEKNGVPGTR